MMSDPISISTNVNVTSSIILEGHMLELQSIPVFGGDGAVMTCLQGKGELWSD